VFKCVAACVTTPDCATAANIFRSLTSMAVSDI
jgi:hypothetical protein